MSKYRYLEVSQRIPSTSRQRESTVLMWITHTHKVDLFHLMWYHFHCTQPSLSYFNRPDMAEILMKRTYSRK